MIKNIIKWDIKRIFSSKKFTAAFILQFFMIVLIVPLFSIYLETLQSGKFFSTTPGMKEFIPIGMNRENELSKIIESYDQFELTILQAEGGMELLRKGVIAAYVFTESDFDEKRLKMESIKVQIYYNDSDKSYVAKSYLDSILDGFSDGLRGARVREYGLKSIPIEKKERSEFSQETKTPENKEEIPKETTAPENTAGPRETSPPEKEEMINIKKLKFSLNREYIVLLIMLLPLFMSGGLLTDSIVSEKEKKTGEMLLVLPTKRRNVALGKMLAIFMITSIQIVLWIFILYGIGKVDSLWTIFPLILAAFLVITVSLLISVYSQNYKESALLITVVYVIMFAFMFGTSILYVSRLRTLSLLSPLSMVIGLEEGTLTVGETLYGVLPALSVSLLSLALSLYLFNKDSFYFGPRPGILELIPDIFSKIGKNNFASFVLGFFSVFGAFVLELLAGFFLYYFFSLEMASIIFLGLIVFIEEYLKYLAMLSNEGKFAGVFTGLGFGVCESLLSGVVVFTMVLSPNVIFLRIIPIFVHMGASGVLGYFRYNKKTKTGFVIALVIHLIYNTAILVLA
ncbi:MAG: ABC transporter permease [Euryarchaeota archaeon]|nr:ABC transporter permease [Euryarchaeota archaeon]